MATTTDGWTIETVEQNGEYAGEEMGKVWLKNPTPRTNRWQWYQFSSVEFAATAAHDAQDMTQAQFEAWYTEP